MRIEGNGCLSKHMILAGTIVSITVLILGAFTFRVEGQVTSLDQRLRAAETTISRNTAILEGNRDTLNRMEKTLDELKTELIKTKAVKP